MKNHLDYVRNTLTDRVQVSKDTTENIKKDNHSAKYSEIAHDIGPLRGFSRFATGISRNEKIRNKAWRTTICIPHQVAISAATAEMVWISNATASSAWTHFTAHWTTAEAVVADITALFSALRAATASEATTKVATAIH